MSQLKKYERGAIIFVDFGKNIGHEFNGKHFAIVLNKKDNEHSGTLQVIPLTSKDKKRRHVKIEKSVIESLIIDGISSILDIAYMYHQIGAGKFITTEHNRINPNKKMKHIENDPKITSYLSKKNALLVKHNYNEVLEWLNKDRKKAQEVVDYYKKYNKFSYARIDAIRQIDKSRIIEGINEFDPIGKVLLPEKYMKRINAGIVRGFID